MVETNPLFCKENITIKQALKLIDDNGKRILFFLNENEQVIGSLTDGDIRRAILKNIELNDQAQRIMNHFPKVLNYKEAKMAKNFMKKNGIECVVLVDNDSVPKDVIFLYQEPDYNTSSLISKVPIFIMAGGKGSRLYPLTKIIPKPLIPIGDSTIIERIITQFEKYGCNEFVVSINEKKNVIKAYFSELEKTYKIHYIEENKPLGTCGSLALAKGLLMSSFFITNCDVLIEANYEEIYKFHLKEKNTITIVSSLKEVIIPYGTLKIDSNSQVCDIIEKPRIDYMINTGMYIIDPSVLEFITENEHMDMDYLIKLILKKKMKVGTYPIGDYKWHDMGQFDQLDEMLKKFV